MGGVGNGVLFGVMKSPPKRFEGGWSELFDLYGVSTALNAPIPDWRVVGGDKTVVGFWVALGHNGGEWFPGLRRPAPLYDFEHTPPYRKASTMARKAWDRFAAWCYEEHRIKLGRARLWLVETEVA